MKYFVCCKSVKTDAQGRGTKSFDRIVAETIKNSLNEQNKDILVHWLEPDTNEEKEENKDAS